MRRPPCLDLDRLARMGPSGGGGGGGNQSTTTETIVPDWVQAQEQANLAKANTLAAQPYTAPPPSVAALSPDQLAAFQAVRDQTGTTAPVFAQAGSDIANLPQTTQSLLDPYLKQVEDTTVADINRSAAQAGQQQAANAVASGAYGGTRDAVQRDLLASETQRNIGSAVANIENTGWQNASQLALQRASGMEAAAAGGQQAGLTDAQALLSAGGTEQTQQQIELGDALQRFQAEQNYPYQQLAISQGALAGTPYGSQVTSSQPYNSNALATTAGLATAALPLGAQIANWSGLFSKATPALSAAAPIALSTAGIPTAGAVTGTAGAAFPSLFDAGATSLSSAVPAAANAGAAATAATGAATAAGKGGADVAAATPLFLA